MRKLSRYLSDLWQGSKCDTTRWNKTTLLSIQMVYRERESCHRGRKHIRSPTVTLSELSAELFVAGMVGNGKENTIVSGWGRKAGK